MRYKIIIYFFLLLFSLPETSFSDTHTVSTCNSANINSAISAATTGDTVYLDCATGTVSSNVTINKAITLQGRTANYKGGSTATTLTMSGAYFELTGSGVMATVVKDIKFTGTVSGGYFIVSTASSMTGWRVTNCWFETGSYAVSTYGLLYGVIDNCRWTSLGGYNQVMVHVEEGDVDAAYARDSSLGTSNNIFIEDNVIIGASAGIEWIMSQNGQGYVFRYNSITNYTLDVHGHCSSGGTRDFEIYENDWYATTNYNEGIVVIRGGTGVIYNNRITTGGYTVWEPAYYLQEISQPTICNSSTGGACHCDTYPCTHQIGRGKNDTLDPLYYWNNTRNGSQINPGVPDGADECGSGCNCGGNDLDYFVQQNRDYYSSASTAKPGYTPYTYPHPLRGVGDTTAPTISNSVLHNGSFW